MHFIHSLSLLVLPGISIAALGSSTSTAVASQSTACGDIVKAQDTVVIRASLAYECLTSVPFNPAVATRFLTYYNDTLQFQSTLTYLKNPPPSYQQPAVDLIGGLNDLQEKVDNGVFTNQYEFEAALQTLIYAAHDTNLVLYAGVLAAFNFGSPHDIISVSLDGIQLPKVYLHVDLTDSYSFTRYQPSAIATINGVDAVTYLTEFAEQNSYGTLESHTDWNQLMISPALDIQGRVDAFSGGAMFYPGDTISFVLENGTKINDYYMAIYNSPDPTGPLETGGDFYNFFVLNLPPASFYSDGNDNNDGDDDDSTDPSAILSWYNDAYPEIPDVAQLDLGTFGHGWVSGYFLHSASIAVLSIPSFDVSTDTVGQFQSTVSQFLARSKAAGLKKVVVDIQQNSVGHPLLAIDTFRQFFPNIEPFAGSRMRAHPFANLTGETIGKYWDMLNDNNEDYYNLAGSEWVSTFRLNANTNEAFENWTELFGPTLYNGDYFTTTQRYNLSSSIFDQSATHDAFSNFTVYGYEANSIPPYAAEDIILLSDGMCASACAIFAEAMNHDAGVRVVVAGGRPVFGPMQAPSGSRGARLYSLHTLDSNMNYAQRIMANLSPPSVDVKSLPNRTQDHGIFITSGSINLRDQVRSAEGSTPLQFAYEAADCRIWFTPQTVYNYTALWLYAADAIWSKSSLCVAGSTGFATTGTNQTNFVGPSCNSTTYASHYAGTNSFPPSITYTSRSKKFADRRNLPRSPLPRDPFSDSVEHYQRGVAQKSCKTDSTCASGQSCASVPTCLKNGKFGDTKKCVPKCTIAVSPCVGGGSCMLIKQTKNTPKLGSQPIYPGYCYPSVPVGSDSGRCGIFQRAPINVGEAPNNKKGRNLDLKKEEE